METTGDQPPKKFQPGERQAIREAEQKRISRRNFLKKSFRVGVGVAGSATLAGIYKTFASNPDTSSETQPTATPVEKSKSELLKAVAELRWDQINDEVERGKLVGLLADEYLKLTGTTRVTKEDMMGDQNLVFLQNKRRIFK